TLETDCSRSLHQRRRTQPLPAAAVAAPAWCPSSEAQKTRCRCWHSRTDQRPAMPRLGSFASAATERSCAETAMSRGRSDEQQGLRQAGSNELMLLQKPESDCLLAVASCRPAEATDAEAVQQRQPQHSLPCLHHAIAAADRHEPRS